MEAPARISLEIFLAVVHLVIREMNAKLTSTNAIPILVFTVLYATMKSTTIRAPVFPDIQEGGVKLT